MEENEKIKHIRKKLGITQQELAGKLGVSKQYLSKVESGGTELSKEKITLLCKTYGISLDWLLQDEGQILVEDNKIYSNFLDNMDNLGGFSRFLFIYNKYAKIISKVIDAEYPNALLEDKLQVARNIFIEDFVDEKIDMLSITETEEVLNKKFSSSDEFKYKILAMYGKAVVDRLENSNK